MSSPLTHLPLDIRLEIYRHLLPTCADILLAPGYKAIYNDDESLDLLETNLVALRHDGQACHPAILRTNHRIYSEAVGIMYSRTFTMTVSMNGVDFLHFDREFRLATSFSHFFSIARRRSVSCYT